jgi:hypothetical protein
MNKNRLKAKCKDCGVEMIIANHLTRHSITYPKHRIVVLEANDYNRKTGFPLWTPKNKRMQSDIL